MAANSGRFRTVSGSEILSFGGHPRAGGRHASVTSCLVGGYGALITSPMRGPLLGGYFGMIFWVIFWVIMATIWAESGGRHLRLSAETEPRKVGVI